MIYKIRTGEEYTNWRGTIDIINVKHIDLTFKSIEDVKKVIDICELKIWEIYKSETSHSWDDELIERCSLWQEYLDREKAEKLEFDTKQKVEADRINTIPEVIIYEDGDHKLVAKIEGEAVYNPSRSRHVRGWYLSTIMYVNGGSFDFDIKRFRTSKGALRRIELLEWFNNYAPLLTEDKFKIIEQKYQGYLKTYKLNGRE